MRTAQVVPTLKPVGVGGHVCWLVEPAENFLAAADSFLCDGALAGDKALVVGSSRATAADPGPVVGEETLDFDVMLAVVRREADTAHREGYRALRVLAHMDHIVPASVDVAAVAGFELSLDELVAATDTIMVCAYRLDHFGAAALDQVACVHPQQLGTASSVPGFRTFSSGENCWSVHGVVDFDGAAAFRTALLAMLRRSPTVTLRLHDVELMDAAGMRALVEAAQALPDRRIVLDGANETVRLCWELLGYGGSDIPVELAL